MVSVSPASSVTRLVGAAGLYHHIVKKFAGVSSRRIPPPRLGDIDVQFLIVDRGEHIINAEHFLAQVCGSIDSA